MSLAVTEAAFAVLKQKLDGVEREPEQALRLVQDPAGNFKVALDTEREGDQVVQHEGATVMLIDSFVSEQLSGFTLDVKDTPSGPSLVLSE